MFGDIVAVAEQVKSNIHNEKDGFNVSVVDFALDYSVSQQLKNKALANNIKYLMLKEAGQDTDGKAAMLQLVDEILADYHTPESWERLNEQTRINHNTEAILYKSLTKQLQQPVFSCNNLGITFKSAFSLENVEMSLYAGEITAVVGENGNGKTTLFNLLAGEVKHGNGEMQFHFTEHGNTAKNIDWPAVKHQIAYVPQELPVWYGSLRENLEYEAAIHGILGKDNSQQVDFIIERLGLQEYINRKWRQLSGGFKLRFALAKALVWKPKLLIMDEPLANLDVITQLIVLKDFRNLANSTTNALAIILSSQHLHEIEAISDKLLFLEQGKVLFNDQMDQIGKYRKYNLFELGCRLQKDKLVGLFPASAHLHIYHNGLFYIIQAPKEFGADIIMKTLIDNRITFTYFRDLSTSIKSLFQKA